jgi:mRNA-degrading endonuclease toxin of MazEF toxin-antitoxin module
LTKQLNAENFPHTLRILPTPGNGLSDISIALVFQISGIDKRILRNRIGQLEPAILSEIEDLLKLLLGL